MVSNPKRHIIILYQTNCCHQFLNFLPTLSFLPHDIFFWDPYLILQSRINTIKYQEYQVSNRMNDILWHKCHGWFLITTKHLNLFQITIFFKFRTKFCFSEDMPYFKITLNSNSQCFAIYMFNTTRHSTTNNHWGTI